MRREGGHEQTPRGKGTTLLDTERSSTMNPPTLTMESTMGTSVSSSGSLKMQKVALINNRSMLQKQLVSKSGPERVTRMLLQCNKILF